MLTPSTAPVHKYHYAKASPTSSDRYEKKKETKRNFWFSNLRVSQLFIKHKAQIQNSISIKPFGTT